MKATYTVVAWKPSNVDPNSEVLVALSGSFPSRNAAEASTAFNRANREGREPFVRSSNSTGATEVHGW